MGIRYCGRKSLSFGSDCGYVNRSFLTSGFKQLVTTNEDQDIVLGITQRDIRAAEIARLNRLNNLYFHTNQVPFIPQVVKFDL